MSKKELTVNENMTQHILDAVRELGIEEISLKGVAMALNAPTTRIFAMAKKPVPGAVYDPDITNWDAISEYVNSKLGQNLAADGEESVVYDTMSAFVSAVYEKDEWIKANPSRRGGSVVAGSNTITVDGVTIVKRKAAMLEMGSENESLLCFKNDPDVYKMVYQTESFTVIRAVNEDGTFAKHELRALSNSTVNTKCVPPSTMTEAIKDRFSGAYLARHPELTKTGETESAPTETTTEG